MHIKQIPPANPKVGDRMVWRSRSGRCARQVAPEKWYCQMIVFNMIMTSSNLPEKKVLTHLKKRVNWPEKGLTHLKKVNTYFWLMRPSLDNKLPVAVRPAMLHNYQAILRIEEYTALLPERTWQRYPESVINDNEENNDENSIRISISALIR